MKDLIDIEVRKKVLVAAHRGSSGTHKENTIEAFRQAIEDGADMIETDVQSTADGIILTHHDLTLENDEKTINIQQEKYNDLKNIDIKKSNQFMPPRLEDVFRLIKDKVYLIIEVKEINTLNFRQVIDKIIGTAKLEEVEGQILISSFYPGYIKYAKSIAPGIPVAAIKPPAENFLPSQLKKSTGCEAFICSLDELNDGIMEDAEKNNVFIGVYSIDDEKDLKSALSRNVNAIATNYPKKIVNLLRK